MNPYLKQYKQTQIDTTPKEQILVMLYEGAVRFLYLAKEGFAENNIEKIHNNLIKVQNIITEFQVNLDMEAGGEFSQTLFDLYEFLSRQLLKANVRKDTEALDIVIKHMTELRDTWKQAVKQYKAEGNSLRDYDDSDKYKQTSVDISDDEDDDEDDDNLGDYI